MNSSEQQKQIIRRARECQQLGNNQAVRECRKQLQAVQSTSVGKSR